MSGSAPVRLLIADERPLVREGLRGVLEAEPGFHVGGQASSVAEAIHLARALAPDVLLIGIIVPGLTEALLELKALATLPTSCRTLLLTASIEDAQLVEALRLGVHGVLTKESTTDLLIRSIRSVMANQYWVERESLSDLRQNIRQRRTPLNGNGSRKTFGLTRRELQIVSTVAAGYTNKDIAQRFSLSEDTVKHHVSHIFDKVGASNRLELALFAIHHRLTDDPDQALVPGFGAEELMLNGSDAQEP